MENLLKMLESNPDLLEQVVKLWKDGASNEKIAEAFAAKGVQVEQVQIEQLLVMLQKERSKTIEKGIPDEDLMKVAGGGRILGSCEARYYKEACTATVEWDSWCGSDDWCAFSSSKYTVICSDNKASALL